MSKKPDYPTTYDGHKKAFINLVEQLSYRHQKWRIFADFCEFGAMCFHNVFPKEQALEIRWAEMRKTYTDEEYQQICGLLNHVTDGLGCAYERTGGYKDFLGDVFQEMELANHWKGQFFTPQTISDVMAQLTMDEAYLREEIGRQGYITIMDPACGSGSTIMGGINALLRANINYQQCAFAVMVDVDFTAANMSMIQASLMNLPAYIYHGNSLSLETFRLYVTPAYHLGFWNLKMSNRNYKQDAVARWEDIHRAAVEAHNAALEGSVQHDQANQ